MKSKGIRKFILSSLAMLFFASLLSFWNIISAQNQNKRPDMTKTEDFRRPEPRPTKPQMPTQNRYQEGKVFLEGADSLYRFDLFEDIKIVRGNVKFRHGNVFMYCDSAFFYTEKDQANCYGHVKLVQGDTLHIYADRLYYNGVSQMAKLIAGPSERKVRLVNRTVQLTTDSLDYSVQSRLGWYNVGGELRDDANTLTSGYGEYSARTKEAKFFRNVVLVNRKDGYKMYTDTLYYNTRTHLARVETKTIIEGKNDTIITMGGLYNTNTGNADLTKRSTIFHRDSNNNVITLEGDSLVYDKVRQISYAYSFRNPAKRATPVVVTDTANKSVLIGGFGYYDNKNRQAMATMSPLLIEYSRPDTVFLRADTIRTMIRKEVVEPDSTGKLDHEPKDYYVAKAYNRARFFRNDIQGVADSITYVEIDSMLYLNRKPVVWSGERQAMGNEIEVHINDSTADWIRMPDKGVLMEYVDEDFYNQLAGDQLLATLEDNSVKRLEVEGSVQVIMLPEEEDSTVNKFVKAESSFLDVTFDNNDLDRLKMWPEVTGTVTPVGQVKNSEKLLPNATWLEEIRPEREWYGGTIRWLDELVGITPALERYFTTNEASLPSSPRRKPQKRE